MNIVAAIVIVLISCGVSMYLDGKCGVKSPPIYWMIGTVGGALSQLVVGLL